MESNKPLRTHPKMTKVLLGQIDSLDKEGHSVEDIAATLNTTPEAVQRGIDKLIDRRRSEIRATPGGAFTVAAQKKTVRAVCAEQSCPWRCDAKSQSRIPPSENGYFARGDSFDGDSGNYRKV